MWKGNFPNRGNVLFLKQTPGRDSRRRREMTRASWSREQDRASFAIEILGQEKHLRKIYQPHCARNYRRGRCTARRAAGASTVQVGRTDGRQDGRSRRNDDTWNPVRTMIKRSCTAFRILIRMQLLAAAAAAAAAAPAAAVHTSTACWWCMFAFVHRYRGGNDDAIRLGWWTGMEIYTRECKMELWQHQTVRRTGYDSIGRTVALVMTRHRTNSRTGYDAASDEPSHWLWRQQADKQCLTANWPAGYKSPSVKVSNIASTDSNLVQKWTGVWINF